MINCIKNRVSRRPFALDQTIAPFSQEVAREILKYHKSIPVYDETLLHNLKDFSRKNGLKGLFVKDESTRFGLKAFKALGASYAIGKLIADKNGRDISTTTFEDIKLLIKGKGAGPFCTASDGNHGRGVAWTANQLGCESIIFLPEDTAKSRVEAIEEVGGNAIVTRADYDETVRQAYITSGNQNWEFVQDSSFEGYRKIPLSIMQGYLTMIFEALEQIESSGNRLSHIFLQAGVGSMAAAVLAYLVNIYHDEYPTTIIIEPKSADCFYKSTTEGKLTPSEGDLKTEMAGLACGIPSQMAYEIISRYADFFVSCDDKIALSGMRLYANPGGDDPKIISGESGAVSLGLLNKIMQNENYADLRNQLNLNKDSRVLLLNTEGDTDPENYRRIVNS